MLISLSVLDLFMAAGLVLLLGLLSFRMRLGLERELFIGVLRMSVQLLLIGLVLQTLFSNVALHWVAMMAAVMVAVAGWEVRARQKRKSKGWWGYRVSVGAMFISSYSITVLTLLVFIGPDPWYHPQYAIPLLGMLLGNTMTGIAVGMDRLVQTAFQQRAVLEQRLLLGQSREQAIQDIRRDSMRSAMMHIINAMMAAGIVSLPGMMTGQILAGAPPFEAVKYQILIMLLIAAGTGFGVAFALWLISRHLFDARHRLRLNEVY